MLLIDNLPTHRVVNAVDCPMGAGKTTAAISYIESSSPREKIVYAALYNDEARRIRDSCPSKDIAFVEDDENHGKPKSPIMAQYVHAGRNIACTHSLLPFVNASVLERIRAQNYTLIVDEALSVIKTITRQEYRDFAFLLDHGCLDIDDVSGHVVFKNDYEARASDVLPSDIAPLIATGHVYYVDRQILVWLFPVDVLDAFKRIIVMSYMLDAQPMYYYLRINKFYVRNLGVRCLPSGEYEFCDESLADGFRYNPAEKIHILEKEKLNRIGETRNALSAGWYSRSEEDDKEGVPQLGRNVRNVQKNVFHCRLSNFMWTCFGKYKSYFLDRNVTEDGYVPFNKRASNEKRGVHYLVYAVDVYTRPDCYNYFKSCGYIMDMEKYSLSVFLQWIWRSAIRDGEDIYIYVPSKRMRTLLLNWMDSISGGGVSVA